MPDRPDPSSVRIDGPWTHRDVHANGIRLHVAEAGDGPVVVLLHGFASFWWTWRHQLTALAGAGLHAVAPDLRGYGDSDKPPRGYDGWTLAGDVAGLVKSLGESRAHLVGHGWGGLLAWTVAAVHPRLVASVTTISAPHPLVLRAQIGRTALRGRGRNQARAQRHLFAAQLPFLPERRLLRDSGAAVERALRARTGAQWSATPDFEHAAARYREAIQVRGAAHCALEYHRWAVRSQLRSDGRRYTNALGRVIEAPAQSVYGAADPTLLPRTREADTHAVPHVERHVLAGVGHHPHEEAPASTNAHLLAFLKN